jgi:hypothetical protein
VIVSSKFNFGTAKILEILLLCGMLADDSFFLLFWSSLDGNRRPTFWLTSKSNQAIGTLQLRRWGGTF